MRRIPAYITAHLAHLERVQSFGITHVDPHCLLLFLNEVTFIFDLEKKIRFSIQFNIQLSCKLQLTDTMVAKQISFSPQKMISFYNAPEICSCSEPNIDFFF